MDIMQAIIDIEEKARGISEAAVNLEQDYERDVNEEIELRKRETEKRINEYLEQLKQRMDVECREEIEELEKAYETKFEALSDICKSKQDLWIQNITQNITKF